MVEGIYRLKEEIADYIRENGGLLPALRAFFWSSLKSDFIQQIGETFATRIVLIGLGLITGVITARILGPEGRGFYAIAVTIATTGIQFGNLGLHASNTYTVARNPDSLSLIVGNSLFVSFIFGGSAAGLTWSIFYFMPSLAPIHGPLLALALLWIPFGLVSLFLQNILIVIHKIRIYNTIELVTQTIGIGLIGLIILLKMVSVEYVYSVTILSLIIGIIWSYAHIRNHLSSKLGLSLPLFKDSIRYGMKAYVAAFFSFLVLRIDMLMVKHFLNAEQAGYYSIAVNMADMVYILPVVVGTLLFPKLSTFTTDMEKWKATRGVALAVGIAMIVVATCASILAVPVVTLLFGKAYTPSVPAFIWLMPGIIMLSINTIFMNFFASTGMPLVTVYSPGIAALLNIFLNYKFIPMWGIIGASISSVIAYALMLLISLLYIFRSGVQTYE